MSADLLERLDRLERRLAKVEYALEDVIGVELPVGPARETRRPEYAVPAPAPPPPPLPRAEPRVPPPAPARPRREVDWGALFGAKGLAIAGGVVTALGIVFFFALAVNRGWIGPGARIVLGSVASLIVLVAGFELRRRYGQTYAAVAAVGAGIAGAYATLLAATALYDFLPEWGALLVAAAIAGVGLCVSIAWREETLAGIGLIGAMVAPALLIFDTGLTAVGTAFVAFMLAAAATVAVALRWRFLLITAAIVAAPQALVLFAGRGRSGVSLLVLSAVFCLVYLAAGIGWQLRLRAPHLAALASSLVVASAGLAFYAAIALFYDGSQLDRGIYLLVFAVAYGGLGAAFFARLGERNLGNLLIALALALGAVGVADALSGGTLTYAWAAEAVALAWLATRVREIRFQIGALAYLALALVHTLAIEAPPSNLFALSSDPAEGVTSVLAVSVAAAAAALWAVEWEDVPRWAVGLRHRSALRITAAALSVVLAIDAASLALLDAYVRWWPGGGESAFDHGQVAVTGLWAAAGVVAVALGARRRGSAVAAAGLVWLGVVLGKTLAYDATQLGSGLYSYAFLDVASALLLASVLVQVLRPQLWPDATVAFFSVVTSLGLTLTAIGSLLTGHVQGAAFLGVAVLYAALAAGFLIRGDRAFATLLWTLAAGVAAAAEAQLVEGQLLVAVWAASGAAFAVLARRTAERRFQLAAIGYLGLAFAVSFSSQATAVDFLSASRHPAGGVLGLVAVVLATFAVARLCEAPEHPALDPVDTALDALQPRLRSVGTWIAGGLALYALSLVILEVAEAVGPRDIATNFQSGHTAVSAVWGLLGLTLLYVGLRGNHAVLRIGGLALFGISLVKLFLYDLSRLSSITRALSFLAVGAVLLFGGFLYQRLGAREEGRNAASA